MKMARNKLTDNKIRGRIKQIQKLAFSAPKCTLLGDGDGLYLSINKNGAASWLFRYMEAGTAKSLGLGAYPSTSLHLARESAQQLREARAKGHDLSVHRKRRKKPVARAPEPPAAPIMTFRDCAAAYIDLARSSWRNDKHALQWSSTLATYAYPVLGNMPIDAVKTDAVVAVLKPIWQTKTETATRVRARIETVIDWATANGYREGDNPARYKGLLQHRLPKLRADRKRHFPSLPYEALPGFLAQLRQQEGTSSFALEFLILCASRTGEVLGARWDEIDLDKKMWTIPKHRMKAGVAHRVPLSERAMAILRYVRALNGPTFVFTAHRQDRPLCGSVMQQLLRRMGYGHVTVHGFRSTFRCWAGEQTTYPFEVCEQALAHRLPDAVAAAYLRSDFYDKRVSLLADWEKYCLSES